MPRPDPWIDILAGLTSVGVLIFDPDGKIQYVSGLARRLLGCSDADTVEDCIGPIAEPLQELVGRCPCDATEGQPGEQALSETIRVDLADGSHKIAVEVRNVNLDSCEGYITLLRDRRQEELMALDLRLVSRFRHLGQLYQALAHDLREPAATALLNCQILRTTLDQRAVGLDDEARRRLESLDAVEAGLRTMEQSLNLLLGELTTVDAHVERFDLRDLLQEAVVLIQPTARNQRIAVSLQLPAEPAWLRGMASRIKLALLNLCYNAIQAMPSGGELHLEIEREPDQTTIVVRDTGVGIPDSARARIFDKYFTTKSSGTGIGLFVASETFREHGARVSFTTELGKGTSFHVRIPTAANDPQTAE